MTATKKPDVNWLRLPEDLLGPEIPAGCLTSERIIALKAGELAGDDARAAQAHLDGCEACQDLAQMATVGLAEAASIEQSLAWQAAFDPSRRLPPPPPPPPTGFTIPFTLPVPKGMSAGWRLEHAEGDTLEKPVAQTAVEQTLFEAPGFTLGYHVQVRGSEAIAQVSVIWLAPESRGEGLTVALDGAAIPARFDDEDGARFDLGPAAALGGKTLEVKFTQASGPWSLTFRFVEPAE